MRENKKNTVDVVGGILIGLFLALLAAFLIASLDKPAPLDKPNGQNQAISRDEVGSKLTAEIDKLGADKFLLFRWIENQEVYFKGNCHWEMKNLTSEPQNIYCEVNELKIGKVK